MAKKDRRNRDSGLGDIMDEFSSSIDAMNSEFEQNLNAIRGETAPPLVDDSDEDDEDEDSEDGFSPFTALFAGCASVLGFLVAKSRMGIAALGTSAVFLGRCAIWPVRKAVSFFRSTGDDEDEEEEIDEVDIPAASRPVSATPKATVAKKVDAADMLADYDDEDEETLSTGQKWLFRGGVLATVMVLASAGYFGYKTWTAKSELGRQEALAEIGDAVPKPEIVVENAPKTPVEPMLASAQIPKPREAETAVKVAEKASKDEAKLKTDKKNEPPTAKKDNKKDDTKPASPPPAPPTKKDAPSLPKVASKPVTSSAENKDGKDKKDGKENGKKTETPPAAPVLAAEQDKTPVKKPPVAPSAKPEKKPIVNTTAASSDKKPDEKPSVAAPLTVSAPRPAEKPESKAAPNDLWSQAASQAPAPVSTAADPWAIPAENKASSESDPSKTPTIASFKTDSAPSADPWMTNTEKAATPTDSPATPAPPTVQALPSFAAPVSEPAAPAAATAFAAEPGFPPLSAPVTPTPTSNVPPAETAATMPKLPAPTTETVPPVMESGRLSTPELDQLKPLAKRTVSPTAGEINEPAPGIPSSTEMSLPKTAYEGKSDTSNQGLDIPAQGRENRAVFASMPTPPAIDPAPMDSSMMPPVREAPKAETIPSISHTGSVRTVAGSNPVPENKTISEAVPGIPVARQPATTFSAPSKPAENERPGIAGRENRGGTSGQPFAPPSFASPTTAAAPVSSTAPAVLAEARATTPPITPPVAATPAPSLSTTTPLTAMVPKNNEPSPTIPEDRPVSTTAFTTPVTPMLPQHSELAKTETPLGSRLQNEVQDLREQQQETPRIRFTSRQTDTESAASATGAVRFNPETARTVKPTLMSVPADSNAATELSVLLPSGTPLPEAEGTEPLPTGESAPQVVMATANPGYGRSMRGRNPAVASLGMSQQTGDRENRATSFKQRLNEEIKRSPTETERYVVQDGDNYMTISDRAFGTGLLFRALAEHNRRRLGIDYQLQPGTVIEIPPAEYLQTNYNDLYQRGRRRLENRPSTSTGASSSSFPSLSQPIRQGIRYVVQEGDTVFNLATNRLKDTPKWREIMALNADTIADPRDPLPAGTEILLPVNQTARTGSVQR